MSGDVTCPYLHAFPVPICTAFTGGLRTPRAAELRLLCHSAQHEQCPFYLARVAAESGCLEERTEVGGGPRNPRGRSGSA